MGYLITQSTEMLPALSSIVSSSATSCLLWSILQALHSCKVATILRLWDSIQRTIIVHYGNPRMLWMNLFQNVNERRPFSCSSEVQDSVSTSEDHRSEWADFVAVHDSPSIGAEPGTAFFQNLEVSDKVLSWRAAIKRVVWQPFSKVLCSLCNSTELKCYIWP